MIVYKPKNEYFNWRIPDKIPSKHWQQLIRQIPYDEVILYFKNNPPIKYVIDNGVNNASNG